MHNDQNPFSDWTLTDQKSAIPAIFFSHEPSMPGHKLFSNLFARAESSLLALIAPFPHTDASARLGIFKGHRNPLGIVDHS